MGWHHNWRHLIASKFDKQMTPHAFVGNSPTCWLRGARVDLIYRGMLSAGETGDKDDQTNQKICGSHERRKESSPRGWGGKSNRVKFFNSQIKIISNNECQNMVGENAKIEPTQVCAFLAGSLFPSFFTSLTFSLAHLHCTMRFSVQIKKNK